VTLITLRGIRFEGCGVSGGAEFLSKVLRQQRSRMRINPVLAFLILAVAAAPAASQDTASSGARNSHSIITGVSVVQLADGVDVEVTSSAPVHADLTVLEHPDRLVFDFPGCELAHAGQRLAVNRGSVIAVRAAEFSSAPPVARVVIDLKSALGHEESYAGNKLVIKLHLAAGDLTPAATRAPNNSALKSQSAAANGVGKTDPFKPKSVEPRTATPTTATPTTATPKMVTPTIVTPTTAPQPLTKAGDASVNKPASPPGTPASSPSSQVHAYALLDKARTLNVSDLETLEAKAQAGEPESETMLALAYHAGTLLKMDDAEALRLLQHAASRGFVAAEESLGIFCQLGYGMPPDKPQAVSWYTKAAQHGSIDAATNLALMYSTGDGIAKDSAKAAMWFRNAAEAGDATAQLNLGVLYHRGEGVPQDDNQAVLWLSKAADQGLLPAMLELARWDMRPQHGGNVDAAVGWYKKAADQGDASAQAALGDIFSDQKLGRVDYAESVHWYRKAADQGNREGQFGLGARFLYGQGVPQDFAEARRWLTPAADRGHPYAQFLLARMFETGDGGPVDRAGAAKYYEPAANYGVAEAQYRLGVLLSSDRGNEQNSSSAYKWLVLAQDSIKESAGAAQQLRNNLNAAEIAQAEREVDEWRRAHARSDSSRQR
jgi:TPR repeat protein